LKKFKNKIKSMTWRIRRCNNFSFPTSMFRFHPLVFIYAPKIVSFGKFGKYLEFN
jgi:hypothetical protein